MDATATQRQLYLHFGGRLVEQLGAQLYPRVTASVAELVSNAWDADASNVWIKIPFDQDWKRDAVIEVLDDGHGMTWEEAQSKYLVVGRNRRVDENKDTSYGGRPLHGRKGIGKLAAFGTAGLLECVTLSGGQVTAFGLDYDKLRRYKPTEDYPVEPVQEPEALLNPDTGQVLPHGTRVRLTRLKAKRRTGEESFRQSMERRFAISADQMAVWINGEPLQRFNIPVEVRFPRDGTPPRPGISVDLDGWAHETISYPTPDDPSNTREVRWWIGFTQTPIRDEDMRGVSVLARGKLAQRPFMFERALGTTGQLGQEYLVGEVSADWLDHGIHADEDLIQSNRDQLQLDNSELESFMKWGRELLTWALAQRNRVRREYHVGPNALGSEVEAVLQTAPTNTRERLRTLAGRIAEITQADSDGVADALRAIVDATDARAAERVAANLALEGDPDEQETWRLLRQTLESVTPSLMALYRARREALARFLIAIGEPPVSRLHREVPSAPWLISPLLADLPAETLHVDDRLSVMRFGGAPPVFTHLTVTCWAVGIDPASAAMDGSESNIQVASAWRTPSSAVLTWEEALTNSISVHDLIIKGLEESN